MAAQQKLIKYNGINVQINAFVFDKPITFNNGGVKTASVSIKYGDIWINHMQVVDNKLKQALSYQSVKEKDTNKYANILVPVNVIPADLSDAILEAIGQSKKQYDKQADEEFELDITEEAPKRTKEEDVPWALDL